MAVANVENVLNYINKNFITLDEGEVKDSNKLLATVLDEITQAMKEVNPLFATMFETYTYSGSSFEGLKIHKPDEYDIDFKMRMPKILNVQINPSDKSGFVYVFLKDWNRFVKDKRLYSLYSGLENLKDANNYLSQTKIKQWMQKIVSKAINKIKENGTLDHIELKISMSGPAVTLFVNHNCRSMSIDLVAVFRILGKKWPAYPYRQNSDRCQKDYLVVPKAPKIVDLEDVGRYWRLSFPDQEKNILNGFDFCKPALRLLKKLRDTRKHNIPSYFLKTIFLWEIEKRCDTTFWNSSLENVFLEMLEVYRDYLKQKSIPYYWNENNNLIADCSDINIENITNYLDGMITKIKSSSDSLLIANYLLTMPEYLRVASVFGRNQVAENLLTSYNSLVSYTPSRNAEQSLQMPQDNTNIVLAGAAVGIGLAGLYAWNKYFNRKD